MLGAEDINMENTFLQVLMGEDSEALRDELFKVMRLVTTWFQS